MHSGDNVRDTGKKIVEFCGQVGLERCIDLALEMVHARFCPNEVWRRAYCVVLGSSVSMW